MSPDLHRELWTSWASLLRSYAGAHGLNAPQHAVVEVSADSITLRVGPHSLHFSHATFTDSAGLTQPFSLNEDGTATLNGSTEEMDLLAERLARGILLDTA